MPTEMLLSPKIDVLHWNARYVYVKCPYCEDTHTHGVRLPGRRTSDCHPGGQYEFIFPIDESRGLVGYEIDKRRARFVNIRFPTSQRDETSQYPDERELSNLFSSKMNISAPGPKPSSLYDDSRELTTIKLSGGDPFEQKRILSAISDCVCGDLPTTSRYLSTSVEKELFLHGRDQDGNTTLICAAMEQSHEMVSLLLKNGAKPNDVNNDRRSALMEAALWGRIKNVKALLNANADKYIRDHEGRCAIDLAQRALKNENERYRRAPYTAEKNVRERDRDRRHISILLGDSNVEEQRYTKPLSVNERINYGFMKSQSEMAIKFCGPIRSHAVPYLAKTAAVLDRGEQFSRISATSGWGVGALPQNHENSPSWIDQVYYIASVIAHEFQDPPNPSYDQGKPGQYYASHAEKKLIAYFIDRHIFIPKDEKPDDQLEGLIDKATVSLAEQKHSSIAWARLSKLEEKKAKLEDEFDSKHWDENNNWTSFPRDNPQLKRLEHEVREIDEERTILDSDVNLARIRAQQENIDTLLRKKNIHDDLIAMSKNQPPISLKEAVILSSNTICSDCAMFKEKVNSHFQLNIEMSWQVLLKIGGW
ncbi:hypothetical protein F5Y10DRAFT_284362 [Nemania abortiva]|nr:hypothetical protein F5Y10DRAFT_284362 [Nemania abortiva]